MDYLPTAVVALFLAAFFGWLIRCNVVYWRKRRAMTPEQQKRFDAETRDEAAIW